MLTNCYYLQIVDGKVEVIRKVGDHESFLKFNYDQISEIIQENVSAKYTTG